MTVASAGLAEIDHRARGDGPEPRRWPRSDRAGHDDYRSGRCESGGMRHDRIGEEGVGKMIEHVGLVLFLSGR